MIAVCKGTTDPCDVVNTFHCVTATICENQLTKLQSNKLFTFHVLHFERPLPFFFFIFPLRVVEIPPPPLFFFFIVSVEALDIMKLLLKSGKLIIILKKCSLEFHRQ